jgi:hypothetical protein
MAKPCPWYDAISTCNQILMICTQNFVHTKLSWVHKDVSSHHATGTGPALSQLSLIFICRSPRQLLCCLLDRKFEAKV